MPKITVRWQKGILNNTDYYMIYVKGRYLVAKGIPILLGFDENRIISELVEAGVLTIDQNLQLVER